MVRARGFAVLIVAAFVAFACGGTSSTGGAKGTIVIASDLPTSGADASSGLPTQYGAAFAVSQKGSVQGYTLQFLPLDDAVNGKHDPTKGTQNVQQFISNSKVLGMVGPFNSGVAAAEIPVANQAPLAMISPSNTNECLTLPFDYCTAYAGYRRGLRPTGKNNYFRVAANDTHQGPAMADFAFDTLKLTKLAVWDDQEPFGLGVANNFATEFTKKGGTVVDRQGFPTATKPDFHTWLNKAKTDGAQGIYAGATSASYGCIPRAQSQGIFDPTSYYLGPDGIGDGQCITDSGTTMGNDHMYASQGVADANSNPSAAATIAAYKVAHPNPTDTAAYTFAGYDCAAILIDAIDRAITKNGGNMPTRQQVIDQMATTTAFKGLTGTYTLNAAGDPTTPALQIQQYKGGAWTTIQNIQL